jgi:hypothetical protein
MLTRTSGASGAKRVNSYRRGVESNSSNSGIAPLRKCYPPFLRATSATTSQKSLAVNDLTAKSFAPLFAPLDSGECKLGDQLLRWAAREFPEAVASYMDKLDDVAWALKCLGSMFRRRAKRDPEWMFEVVRSAGDQVLVLSPYIKAIEFGDLVFPGRLTWREWIAAAKKAEELFD